jgi:mono/diheme cytochrome c family protein
MRFIWHSIIVCTLLFVATVGFVYSGIYPMAADSSPHNKITFWLLETLRERSIARAAQDITVPNLDDPALLLMGGADYNDMCVACHLKPGKTASDMSVGLYPAPPNLVLAAQASDDEQLRRQFWIIKHGIRASGMPAWGSGHDDERIWAMVAFLQKLPALNPLHYQILTARSTGTGASH